MANLSRIGTPEIYMEKFRLLASQIGPNFRYTDAVGASVWSTHISIKLGLSYNDMRQLAGLPLLKLGRHQGEETKKRKKYVPMYTPRHITKSKGPLVNPCLGLDIDGEECNKKLPKGQHFCARCKKRKDGL